MIKEQVKEKWEYTKQEVNPLFNINYSMKSSFF